MSASVSVSDLGVLTLTRARGREAARALVSRFPGAEIDLALDTADMLSGSFLDGLVQELAKVEALDRVTLVTSDERTRAKLARIAALHSALSLYVRALPKAARELVAPASLTEEVPVFEPTKDERADPGDLPSLDERPR